MAKAISKSYFQIRPRYRKDKASHPIWEELRRTGLINKKFQTKELAQEAIRTHSLDSDSVYAAETEDLNELNKFFSL